MGNLRMVSTLLMMLLVGAFPVWVLLMWWVGPGGAMVLLGAGVVVCLVLVLTGIALGNRRNASGAAL